MTNDDLKNNDEENDYQMRRRLYEETYANNSNLITLNNSEFNTAIRYFIPTLLIVLFTGISFKNSNSIFFKAILIMCFSTIITNMLTYPFASYSLKKNNEYSELYYLKSNRKFRYKEHWTGKISFLLEVLSTILLIVSLTTFIIGFFNKNLIIKGALQ